MKLWKTIDKYFSTEEISEIFNDKNFKPFTTQWYSIGSLTPFQTKLIDGAQEAVGSSFKNLSAVIGVVFYFVLTNLGMDTASVLSESSVGL